LPRRARLVAAAAMIQIARGVDADRSALCEAAQAGHAALVAAAGCATVDDRVAALAASAAIARIVVHAHAGVAAPLIAGVTHHAALATHTAGIAVRRPWTGHAALPAMQGVVGGRDAGARAIQPAARARRAAPSLIAHLRCGAADVTSAAARWIARDVHAAPRAVAKAVFALEATLALNAAGGAAR